MKVKLDVKKYPPNHQMTVVQCEKCGVFYEPYGKVHKCRKLKEMESDEHERSVEENI